MMRVIVTETSGDYVSLGKWVAQIDGLPQARQYGKTFEESLGRLLLTHGKDRGDGFVHVIQEGPETLIVSDPMRKK